MDIKEIEDKIKCIFDRIEIYPEYDSHVLKITVFNWNKQWEDFMVTYYVGQSKYKFHVNKQLASLHNFSIDYLNPLDQLESEVMYIKRMLERGIGSKEYYPFTTVG